MEQIYIMIYLPNNFNEFKLFIKTCDKYLSHLYKDKPKVFMRVNDDTFARDVKDYFHCHGVSVSLDHIPSHISIYDLDCILAFNNVSDSTFSFENLKRIWNEYDVKYRIIDYNTPVDVEYA